MNFAMRMVMTMICGVCREDRNRPDPDALMVALCGAAKWKVCPCCHKTVDDCKDRNYRARARRWVAKQRRKR